MKKYFTQLCTTLVMTTIASTALAGTINVSSVANPLDENIIANRLERLVGAGALQMNERIMFEGTMPDKMPCLVEIMKQDLLKDYKFNGSYIDINIISGEADAYYRHKETVFSTTVFNKGTSEMWRFHGGNYDYQPNLKFSFTLNESANLLQLQHKKNYGSYTWSETIENTLTAQLSNSNELTSVTGIRKKKYSEILSLSDKEETVSTCQNLKRLGVRKMADTLSNRVDRKISLLDYCGAEYSALCPNAVSVKDLVKVIPKITMCQKLEQIQSKLGEQIIKEHEDCCEANKDGEDNCGIYRRANRYQNDGSLE